MWLFRQFARLCFCALLNFLLLPGAVQCQQTSRELLPSTAPQQFPASQFPAPPPPSPAPSSGLPPVFMPFPSHLPPPQFGHQQSGRISTHVLDIANGRPATALNCSLSWWDEGRRSWLLVGVSQTNEHGRIGTLLAPELAPPNGGVYKIRFETAAYFEAHGQATFFPFVEVVFAVNEPQKKFHVPLTLSNFGYSTYRGQ